MQFFHATMDTGNFSFEGFGATHDVAVGALRSCWNAHADYSQGTGRDVPKFDDEVRSDGEGKGTPVPEYFGMSVKERQLGQGYRDGEPLGEHVK